MAGQKSVEIWQRVAELSTEDCRNELMETLLVLGYLEIAFDDLLKAVASREVVTIGADEEPEDAADRLHGTTCVTSASGEVIDIPKDIAVILEQRGITLD